MKDIITCEHIERTLAVLSIAAPVCGTLVGAIVGRIRRKMVTNVVAGLLLGLLGTAVFELWRVYHLCGKHSGYTGVGFLGGQAVLFAAAGLLAGFVIQKSVKPPRSDSFIEAKSNQEDKLTNGKGVLRRGCQSRHPEG